jgi:anti-sigma factor RsiW
MSECTEREIRDMLPDVLHGTIVPGDRSRIEAHLAACGECRTELRVLREVRGAAVFAPTVDVDGIVRKIPPYTVITPEVKRPAASRTVAWLVAAGLALVVAGGSSLLMPRSNVTDAPSPVAAVQTAPPAHSLALASGIDDLSDTSLAQLISEIDAFDALPASELDAVVDVDMTSTEEQDSL